MQVGDKVTIAGTVTSVHGEPHTHAPELCSVQVLIPGGQTLWVSQGSVEPVAERVPDPLESAKPKRGRHERKVVEQLETPGDNAAAATPEG